jgi:hypothetical protein
VVSEGGGDRDGAQAGSAFRLADYALLIDGLSDSDDTTGQVDVYPSQAAELSGAQAGVERRRPQCAVSRVGERGDESAGFVGAGDPVAAAADGGQIDAARRVHAYDAVSKGAPVDHAERHQRVADRARRLPRGEEPVGDGLDVSTADVGEASAAQVGQDVQRERLVVTGDGRRLVRVA